MMAILLAGFLSVQAQWQWTDAQLAQWQSIAETYYFEGIDEEALLGNDYNPFHTIGPGMIGPDFTLLDYRGNSVMLSQFRGEAFVVLISGSWH